MRAYFVVCLISVLSGCVAVRYDAAPAPVATQAQGVGAHPLTEIERVYIGMNKNEVRGIMGPQLTVGYTIADAQAGTTTPVVVASPYRQETFRSGKSTYDVFYYYTVVRNPDAIIADDELMPIVFEKDVVIGKGWNFLFALRK